MARSVLDAAGAVLRPAILWNDTRAHAEAAVMDADPQFRAVSGNIVFPGFTAPKIAWMAAHEPELREKIAKVLLPKDYLRFWLTGEAVGEMSDAAGTSWLDPAARDWSDALLAATGLTRAQMPRLVEGSAVSGALRDDLARRWGMGSVVVAGGAGDNAAAGIGVGAVTPGQGLCLARHLRRAVCRDRGVPARCRHRGAYLLSRRAGDLAPDGCDPGRPPMR